MAAAAAAAMTAAGCGGAGAARSLSRFRGCLAGALLGDCVGAVYEARDIVDLTSVLRQVQGLEPDPGSPGSARTEALCYTDDTAMARALVRSLLAKEAFDEVDMAHRFAQEYKKDPDRGYGAGVITVFRKLLSPKCRDVFEPARAQFNGKGSYGNGGAMRVAGISLAYSSVQDVQKFARLSAQLTHASSLGYNGAILQALAVHLALQGESSSEHFLEQLLGHMEELERDARSVSDARELGMEEHPYSSRLKKIGELLEQDSVTREEVVSELASKGLSSIPSHLVGTQTPLPPWLGPLLAPTTGWSRCQRAGSKAVRAMRKQTSWPRACTGSSRRVCEGHSCWGSAMCSRTSYSSDRKPWAPSGLALSLPGCGQSVLLGLGSPSGRSLNSEGGTGAIWCWVPGFCRALVLPAPQSDMRDWGRFYFGEELVAFSFII
ncbi:ADP-ribosylhydrolase ARH3 isoform X1 [Hippopotamus amphibius kiboko]|uniref:ADP-ribosylhydrolase ARH3 isoform X1 n=1 Tax=Hippopotamus amphibius kiboko TaxID=575201 RepID=UPI0025960B2F|nr:ADP-ribosylhydrolase ARH3 isoform X1 [Hippopotamus amphibius kiboko]